MYVSFAYKCRLFIHIHVYMYTSFVIKEFFLYSLLFSASKYFQNFFCL